MNKQRERFLLERFIEAAGFDSQIVEEREAPDFVVLFRGMHVGVEVTEIFNRNNAGEDPLQVSESISTRIVNRAREVYESSGAPPVHLSAIFGAGPGLRRINMNDAAQALASFVKNLDLEEWQRIIWRRENLADPLPEEIAYLQVLRVPKREMAHWGVARAGWLAPVAAQAIQDRVDDKARSLKDYSAVAPENWLLIVADLTKPSQLMKPAGDFDPQGISSPFTRTFFYRYPERWIVELGPGEPADKLCVGLGLRG